MGKRYRRSDRQHDIRALLEISTTVINLHHADVAAAAQTKLRIALTRIAERLKVGA